MLRFFGGIGIAGLGHLTRRARGRNEGPPDARLPSEVKPGRD
jgi:hypothetical protein